VQNLAFQQRKAMTAKPDIVERLRELARKATPQGEWRFSPWHIEEGPDAVRADDYGIVCTTAGSATAEYIAAANPQAILALLDEITALRKRLEDAERERDEAYERAAKVCEEQATRYFQPKRQGALACADAIRALAKGEKQQPQQTGD
jgi:hypothetical protein